jgi:hypothetical protein
MVKLIIQKNLVQQQQKVLELFLWLPILVLALGILGFVGKGAGPLIVQLREGEDGWRVFFTLSLVLWAIHYKQEL